MFPLAIGLGIYSYLIFFVGLLGWLYKPVIIVITLGYILLIIICNFKFKIFNEFSISNLKNKQINFSKGELLLLTLFGLQVLVNLIGALGPELAFDALWYHLTIPKLFLAFHRIGYIPGGL